MPFFAPCRPHPAGHRPQDKPILSRAFYNLFYQGLHPKPALLFLIAKKTLRAAFAKKLAPGAAVRRTNLFLYGHFTTFFIRGCTPNPPYFFHCKKVSKKLAPREAIKFIFIRAFYNSLRSNK